jgi:membrane fusion protein (multidrug efflux system)
MAIDTKTFYQTDKQSLKSFCTSNHMNQLAYINRTFPYVLAIFTATLLSCGSKDKPTEQGKVAPYKVIDISETSATLYAEFPARLKGAVDVDIRPKIDGYIEKMWVDEGQEVHRGQTLFTINNPQYAQSVNSAKAAISSAKAALAAAELQLQKTKPLVEQNIISKFELESAELNVKSAKAALEQAQANYNNAQINLGYTTVTSPVDGIVGLLPYRIGSYVNSATAEPLTTISDISKVYAYFAINEKTQLALAEQHGAVNFNAKIKQLPDVELTLSNNEPYPLKGKIETFSGQVNAQTGAYNVRAVFNNPNRLLRSGSSAVVKLPTQVEQAILIPQFATTELQNKKLAYIVSDSNTVKAVNIKYREVPGGKYYVVDSGLSLGQKLIVEGIGILTEGTKIDPSPTSLDSVINK